MLSVYQFRSPLRNSCKIFVTLVLMLFSFTVAAQSAPVPEEAKENQEQVIVQEHDSSPENDYIALTEVPQLLAQSTDADLSSFRMPTSVIIGAREEIRKLPGSGTFLDAEDIRYQSYTDINRVLRKVPGVYIREEDGLGLFPNISLRGVDTTRSAKVTLMEDGVLLAPAPYSAPAAYFTPAVARMDGLEVIKGSSQVRYGPHTTGGVINYISTPIPDDSTAYIRSHYGTENDLNIHAYVSERRDTDIGIFRVLLEGYARTTDGFKTIDETPDFRDGNDTGFFRIEPMVKASWEPNWGIYNKFETKFSYHELDANETYLGLTEEDFARTPFRRYAASRFDNFKSDRKSFDFRHYIEPASNMDVTTTVYWAKFRRNWFKLHDVRDENGNRISLSRALAEGGSHLATIKGEAPGELRVRNNNRSYQLWGIESVLNYRYSIGEIDNMLTFGVRYHNDYVRRFQRDELFTQAANGTIIDRDPGVPGDAGNRREETDALAFFLKNEVMIGKLSIIPGIRYEYLDQKLRDFDNPSDDGTNTLNLVGGGVGVNYYYNEELTFFGGIHRGFSPPSPRGAIRDGLEEETSIATELGTRYINPQLAFAGEITGFFTYFNDLIVIDNIGGTGTGDNENVGKVRSFGLEIAADFDPGTAFGWGFKNPYFVAFTYTNAELRSDTTSLDPESIFSGAEKGNKVPYIPEFQITAGTGIEYWKVGLDLTATYVDDTFASGNNTSLQIAPDGTPDARFGKIDSFFIVDVSAFYKLKENIKVIGGIHNLFDEKYMVSRQPHGPRPGSPLFAFVGLEMIFN